MKIETLVVQAQKYLESDLSSDTMVHIVWNGQMAFLAYPISAEQYTEMINRYGPSLDEYHTLAAISGTNDA